MDLATGGSVLTALGLALPAGLNAYIPLLGIALAQRFGVLSLNDPWSGIGEWWAIALIVVLGLVEFFADKVPAVDHVNDVIQSFIRPVAGAVVALAASGNAGENYPVAMVALGVLLAGGVHAAKATARPVINGATGGIGAPVASVVEDVMAVVSTVLAILFPVLVIAMAVLFVYVWWRLRERRRARV